MVTTSTRPIIINSSLRVISNSTGFYFSLLIFTLQEAELDRVQQARQAEIKYVSEKNTLEVKKSDEIAGIQMKMFEAMITSLGQETLRDIAVSGQENQLKLLQAIGLKSTLITDGNTPINLFSTAQGLVGNFIKNNEITEYQDSTES